MPLITVDNANLLKRYDFTGDSLPTDWNLLTLGSGQSVSVANSVMTIAAGTTAGAQTIVRCTQPIRIRSYIRFVCRLSQRITNQNTYLEVTNAAGTTFARYDFNGTSASSGQAQTGNGGTNNTPSTAAVPTTANFTTFDIYADSNDVVFSSVASNSNALKSGVMTFDRSILDPDEDYFVQVRVLNGASAPLSNTDVNIDAVIVQDLTSLKVDVVRGDGTAALANTQPVNVLSMPTVNALATSQDNLHFTESVDSQSAGSTLTGSTRDVGVQAGVVHRYSTFNAIVFASGGGLVRIEMSTNGSNWRPATLNHSVPSGSPLSIAVPVCARYHRAVYVNGASESTEFMLNTSYTSS